MRGKGLREGHSRWSKDGQELEGGSQLAIHGRSSVQSEQGGKNHLVKKVRLSEALKLTLWS